MSYIVGARMRASAIVRLRARERLGLSSRGRSTATDGRNTDRGVPGDDQAERCASCSSKGQRPLHRAGGRRALPTREPPRRGRHGRGVPRAARAHRSRRRAQAHSPRPARETHLRAWMLREARAANRVDHAHIIDIHDIGETEEGELYLVMEYLVGTPLSAEIAKGPFAMARAVDVLEQMAAALGRAHDLGVVHRDLKSDNILLTNRVGRKDFVKILDFGLAHLARDPRLAPKGAVFGTPEYMSPEQARGDEASPSSDLYALGVLLYEMSTGKLPFHSHDREQLLEMQRTAPPPNPRNLRADLHPEAEKIILKLLQKDLGQALQGRPPPLRGPQGPAALAPLGCPWEVLQNSTTGPVQPQPPPPAPSPGVAEWATRAAHFGRMVSRAYPGGRRSRRTCSTALEERVAPREPRLAPRGRGRVAHAQARGARTPRPRAARRDRPQGRGARARGEPRAARGRRRERDRVAAPRAAPRGRAQPRAGEGPGRRRRAAEPPAEPRRARSSSAPGRCRPSSTRVANLSPSTSCARPRRTRRPATCAGRSRTCARSSRATPRRWKRTSPRAASASPSAPARASGTRRAFSEASDVIVRHLRGRPECRDLLEEFLRDTRAAPWRRRSPPPTRRAPRRPPRPERPPVRPPLDLARGIDAPTARVVAPQPL